MVRRRPQQLAPGQLSLGLIRDGEVMRDLLVADIRASSRTVIVVGEFALRQGVARADVAVIGDRLDGYEIKSDRDDLRRLGIQARSYNEVFDTVTLVTCPRHVRPASAAIPGWWGLAVAAADGQALEIIREPSANPAPDAYALARLLRHDEAVAIVAGATGLGSRPPRRAVWNELVRQFEADELRSMVRQQLKQRTDWTAAY